LFFYPLFYFISFKEKKDLLFQMSNGNTSQNNNGTPKFVDGLVTLQEFTKYQISTTEQIAKLNESVKNLVKEISSFMERIEEKIKDLDDKISSVKELENKIAEIGSSMQIYKEIIKEQKRVIDDINEKLHQTENRIHKLETEVEKMGSRIVSLEKARDELHGTIRKIIVSAITGAGSLIIYAIAHWFGKVK
jgi:SMC interacting uncharacterized protein involved in chromosome segregation